MDTPTARGERATLLLLFTVIAATAAAFAWPWLPRALEGAALLDRYAPLRDGQAALWVVYDSTGTLQEWQSENVAVLRSGRAMGAIDLRRAQQQALKQLFQRAADEKVDPRRLAGARILTTTTRRLQPTGEIATTAVLHVRDARAAVHAEPGDFLVALYDAAAERDFPFEPAIRTLPPDLHPGKSWQQEGKLGDGEYRFRGHVRERVTFPYADSLRNDCLRIETQLVITLQAATLSDERWQGTYCAQVGLVEELTLDADGRTLQRRVRLSATDGPRALEIPALPASAVRSRDGGAPPNPERWSLKRVARFGRNGAVYEGTISPTWIPTAPALLLVAGHGGELVAYDADAADGTIAWTFRAGGTVYGAPAWDPERQRISFGASDKRLYALDARGLFLWSFPAGDNIATRPVVVGEVVVFGSEDRNIYGVDARTGTERWHHQTTAAPVASSPAVVGGRVVIGSDDGSVRVLDPASGEIWWSHDTDARSRRRSSPTEGSPTWPGVTARSPR